jgi:F-box interacting protein
VINFHSFGHAHGFGYDPVTNDYKIISRVLFTAPQLFPSKGYVSLGDTSLESFWEIYSLRSNSWRKLDVLMPTSYPLTDKAKVYMNGVCHWWRIIYHFDSKNESELVSFDLSNEVFFTTHVPLNIVDSSDKECHGHTWWC